jgi:hypothetical protein
MTIQLNDPLLELAVLKGSRLSIPTAMVELAKEYLRVHVARHQSVANNASIMSSADGRDGRCMVRGTLP